MSPIRLNLVVAACNNFGIGINGELPWRLKKDMAFFKKITSETNVAGKQNAVIMGRKTWFSIPEKFRPLKGRVNIVLSRELKEVPDGVHIARSLPDAIKLVSSGDLDIEIEHIHIIGGSSVYKEAMTGPYDCRIYLTRILKDFVCDTFLPTIDETTFRKIKSPEGIPEELQEENDISFKFEVYDKYPSNICDLSKKLTDPLPSSKTTDKGLDKTDICMTNICSDGNKQSGGDGTFTFNIMAAMCHNNRGIGMDSKLPWPSLSGDCQRFLRMTSTPKTCDNLEATKKKIVHINGKNTFLSVGKEEMSLPNVVYIVVSPSFKQRDFAHPKILKIVESFEEAIDVCHHMYLDNELDSVWIMGGTSIYQCAIHHDKCDKLYLTHVYKDFPSDTFFPPFEQYFSEYRGTDSGCQRLTEDGIEYEFKVYAKKKAE